MVGGRGAPRAPGSENLGRESAKPQVRALKLRCLSVYQTGPRIRWRSGRFRGRFRARPDQPTRTRTEVDRHRARASGRRRGSATAVSRYRNWVAQIGSSTVTVSTPSRTETSRACAATSAPTTSLQRASRVAVHVAGGEAELGPDLRQRVRERHRLVAAYRRGQRSRSRRLHGRRSLAGARARRSRAPASTPPASTRSMRSAEMPARHRARGGHQRLPGVEVRDAARPRAGRRAR